MSDLRIMERLREQTQRLHERAHRLPFFKALFKTELQPASYVGQLRCLAIIHGVLEREAARAGDAAVSLVMEGCLPKLPLLLDDLRQFEGRGIRDIMPAVRIALSVADDIMTRKETNPRSLIGYLYTLEGSTLGGQVIKPRMARIFNLEGGAGLCFLNSYGDAVTENWHRFSDRMRQAVTEETVAEEIIASSRALFEALIRMYECLHPVREEDLGTHVTALNPEAGDHPITTDPREIAAARRAARSCRETYPYYDMRYGERGRRFCTSDVAWLVTLTGLDEAAVIQQVIWLADLLARRGMPRITMETQLEMLCSELTEAAPEKEGEYRKLLAAAEHLRQLRTAYMPPELFDTFASEFEHGMPARYSTEMKNTGKLIVSALADELAEIDGALGNLQIWLTDPERFAEEWIRLVNAAIPAMRMRIPSARK